MSPITVSGRMMRVLAAAYLEPDGVMFCGRPQARGLVARGLAITHSYDQRLGRLYVQPTAAGYAVAAAEDANTVGHAQQFRNRDHETALAEGAPQDGGPRPDAHATPGLASHSSTSDRW